MSSGYSESAILDRVRTATRAVVAGEAAYERDSVLFDKADYPFALITALLRAAASADMRLDVIDFGGSLGRSEEHTSELQSLMSISYAVFCLKKKKTKISKQR